MCPTPKAIFTEPITTTEVAKWSVLWTPLLVLVLQPRSHDVDSNYTDNSIFWRDQFANIILSFQFLNVTLKKLLSSGFNYVKSCIKLKQVSFKGGET